jgi:hypothetical protein
MALKELAVEGLTTGIGGNVSVSINLTPVPATPCTAAGLSSSGLVETPCTKSKATGKKVLTGAQVGISTCPLIATGVVVTQTVIKAIFSATSTKVKVETLPPLRRTDAASGGSCIGVRPLAPYACANTFTGSIDNAGQSKVLGE